jgi:hypothetical protein
MRHIIGTVVDVQRLTSTSNGNPRADVTIEHVNGTRDTYRTMSDASLTYGIDESAYADRVHVFELTDAGRLRAVNADVTSAYHRLTRDFPRGATVHTITTRGGGSDRVRVLWSDGDVIDDVSFPVAALTTYRPDRTRSGVIVPGTGAESAVQLVRTLARKLYGDAGALSQRSI